MQKRIYYHDTDAGGVVYYANYLKYMEEARTDFFQQRGIFIKELAGKGCLFVISHQEIDYKAPARYADILEISTKLLRATAVKFEFEHTVENQQGVLICIGRAVLVCVDNQIKPQQIPDELKNKLA